MQVTQIQMQVSEAVLLIMTKSWRWFGKIVRKKNRDWIILTQDRRPRFYVNYLQFHQLKIKSYPQSLVIFLICLLITKLLIHPILNWARGTIYYFKLYFLCNWWWCRWRPAFIFLWYPLTLYSSWVFHF